MSNKIIGIFSVSRAGGSKRMPLETTVSTAVDEETYEQIGFVILAGSVGQSFYCNNITLKSAFGDFL